MKKHPRSQGLEELKEWVNPDYLVSSMVDQCAAAFNDNGSTIQLHRFLKVWTARVWRRAVAVSLGRLGTAVMGTRVCSLTLLCGISLRVCRILKVASFTHSAVVNDKVVFLTMNRRKYIVLVIANL